ncbi:MAG TPA: hypothetical protein VFN55_02900 [Solirubrobacteraceae bacterium]|nr:hypothetical protein [Solirubrobacteraceae bacterium]
MDLRRARELTQSASHSGLHAGQLFSEVIRPAMKSALDGSPASSRLAADIGLTVLADALEGEAAPAGHGTGRAALVAHGDTPMALLDGNAISAFLSWTGWRVGRLGSEAEPRELSDLARGGAVELVVIIVNPDEPVAALEPLCTSLRRATDPPVIVLADLAGGDGRRASLLALGADDVVDAPLAVVQSASARSPVPGQRRWGVRLLRSGDTLTVAPTGCLDGVSIGRLADIAVTRTGSFRTLVLDLRDLSEIEPEGIEGLLDWPERVACGDIRRELLVDGPVRHALHRATVAGWTLTESAA